jgi:hypothetical protein
MTAELPLREEQGTVACHFENASASVQEVDFCVRVLGPNLGRQTGGPGSVVSNDAVADRDVHD